MEVKLSILFWTNKEFSTQWPHVLGHLFYFFFFFALNGHGVGVFSGPNLKGKQS